MCGISALFSLNGEVPDKEALKLFLETWIEQDIRGGDACGVFALGVMGGRRHVFYSKHPVKCADFVPRAAEVWRRHGFLPVYAIAHARAATHGSPMRNVNNHPIVHVVDDAAHALVHNGVVSSMKVCDKKVSETDSEEILCLLRRHVDGSVSEDGLKAVYDGIMGSATFFYMVVDNSLELKRFIVGKHINPLEYVDLGNARVYGSIIFSKEHKPTYMSSGMYDLLGGVSYNPPPSSLDSYLRHPYHYYYYVTPENAPNEDCDDCKYGDDDIIVVDGSIIIRRGDGGKKRRRRKR